MMGPFIPVTPRSGSLGEWSAPDAHTLLSIAFHMGVDHGGHRGGQVPPEFGAGAIVPQILSCCKILSTRLLALQCRKMCFCLYSRTFIVSPAMLPSQNSSQIYAYARDPLPSSLPRSGSSGEWSAPDAHTLLSFAFHLTFYCGFKFAALSEIKVIL